MGRFLRLLLVMALIAYVVGRFTLNFHRLLNTITTTAPGYVSHRTEAASESNAEPLLSLDVFDGCGMDCRAKSALWYRRSGPSQAAWHAMRRDKGPFCFHRPPKNACVGVVDGLQVQLLQAVHKRFPRGDVVVSDRDLAEHAACRGIVVRKKVKREAERRNVELVIVPTARAITELRQDTQETNAIR